MKENKKYIALYNSVPLYREGKSQLPIEFSQILLTGSEFPIYIQNMVKDGYKLLFEDENQIIFQKAVNWIVQTVTIYK